MKFETAAKLLPTVLAVFDLVQHFAPFGARPFEFHFSGSIPNHRTDHVARKSAPAWAHHETFHIHLTVARRLAALASSRLWQQISKPNSHTHTLWHNAVQNECLSMSMHVMIVIIQNDHCHVMM